MTPWVTPHSTGLATKVATSLMLVKVFSVSALMSMFLKLSKLSSMGVLEDGEGGGATGFLFSSS